MVIRLIREIPHPGFYIDVVEVSEGGNKAIRYDVRCTIAGCYWESFALDSEADARSEWEEHECTDLDDDGDQLL